MQAAQQIENEMVRNINPTSVRQQLISLQVGEALTLQARQINYARVLSSTLNFELDRTYSVAVNRYNRTVTVTRKK
jgi:hypothetical protein